MPPDWFVANAMCFIQEMEQTHEKFEAAFKMKEITTKNREIYLERGISGRLRKRETICGRHV